MPALNPQTVLASSKCFACLGASLSDLLRLGLWDDISQGGVAPPDFNGNLVYYQQGIAAPTVIPGPVGAYNLTLVPAVTAVHCHNCPLITGITLNNSAVLTTVDFINCPAITGWTMQNCDALTSLNLSFMTSGNSINIAGCALLASINLTGLTTANSLQITQCPVTSMSFPALISSAGVFFVYDLPLVTSITMPVMTGANNLSIRSNPLVTSYNFPSLVTVNLNLDVSQCGSLVTFSAGNLVSVGNLITQTDAALQSVSVPNLQILGSYSGDSCDTIVALDFPSLTFIGGTFSSTGCFALTTISYNAAPLSDGMSWLSIACNLDQATVDQILQSGVDGAITADTIDLSGGTNSPPSVVGLANAATLSGNGVTVSYN